MEIYKNVYQIQSLFNGRNLFQYFFKAVQRVLIDTGIAETPEKAIFPYLDQLGLGPQGISLAITTHADMDHQGGNDAIKRASPATWLACGEADRELVEDPRALYDRRYNHLMEEHGVGVGAFPPPEAGNARKMDLTFSGGETLRLADDWRLEVLHVPGHSRGHLALYDRRHKAAFVGDAIHGGGCPKATGGMAIPVTYYKVDVYLSTLRYFETLPVDVAYSGHWPVMRGEEFQDFIAESRRTVELFDRIILSSLAKHAAGLTLKEIIDAVATTVGEWPEESWTLAMFPAKGHLDRLQALGRIRLARASRPALWQLTA
jgi:glyoxylase-like metal-dependent hydrolase (beta-lactamase superfamily II)